MTGLARKWKERVNFIFPVLFVIGFASVLVYFSLLSTIQVHAVVFQASEGQSAPWWQGILNALIFIIPAVGFAFVIAFLVKKRRMNVIRVFFASALFLTTTIISFFFIVILEQFVWQRITRSVSFNDPLYNAMPQGDYFFSVYLYPDISLASAVAFSLFMGFVLSNLIISRKYPKKEKNQALLLIGGLMGSFLSFILPWWTVIPMLLLLVIYDIYAVFKGPIKDIFESAHDQKEADLEKGLEKAWNDKSDQGETVTVSAGTATTPAPLRTPKRGRLMHKFEDFGHFKDPGAAEDMLSSMTYGTKDWELGIGDLVFYAMLGSQTLMVGSILISDFGILAPWIFFLTTLVGISIGFVITIKLLDRNVMLPGLPIPIVLGLAAMGLTYLGFYLLV